jgi:type II secretory pathway component PulM
MTLRGRLTTLGPRDRRALRTGAWLLGPLLFASLVLRPYATSTLASYSMLDDERGLLEREARAVKELPRDIATLQATAAALTAAAPRLFNGADPVTASADLARYATAAATECGLKLEQSETETRLDTSGERRSNPVAPAGPPDGSLRVSIRARGGILGIFDFLRAMEAGPKLVRVERIEIVRASADDAFDGTLTLMATLSGLGRRSVSSEGATTMVEGEP